MKSIKNLDRFSVEFNNSKTGGETTIFATLEEATAFYNEISNSLLSDTNSLEDDFWRNNKEGLSCELRQLIELPKDEVEKFLEAEDEDEQNYIWGDLLFTYSKRLKTKKTFLSDEFDETIGKNGEFIVKEQEFEGIAYGTYFGEKQNFVNIDNIEENA